MGQGFLHVMVSEGCDAALTSEWVGWTDHDTGGDVVFEGQLGGQLVGASSTSRDDENDGRRKMTTFLKMRTTFIDTR